jgi:hypothetical protein
VLCIVRRLISNDVSSSDSMFRYRSVVLIYKNIQKDASIDSVHLAIILNQF